MKKHPGRKQTENVISKQKCLWQMFSVFPKTVNAVYFPYSNILKVIEILLKDTQKINRAIRTIQVVGQGLHVAPDTASQTPTPLCSCWSSFHYLSSPQGWDKALQAVGLRDPCLKDLEGSRDPMWHLCWFSVVRITHCTAEGKGGKWRTVVCIACTHTGFLYGTAGAHVVHHRGIMQCAGRPSGASEWGKSGVCAVWLGGLMWHVRGLSSAVGRRAHLMLCAALSHSEVRQPCFMWLKSISNPKH